LDHLYRWNFPPYSITVHSLPDNSGGIFLEHACMLSSSGQGLILLG